MVEGGSRGALVWAITWVLPLTFMILMAWSCESHARELGNRALSFYGGDTDSGALVALSLVVATSVVASRR